GGIPLHDHGKTQAPLLTAPEPSQFSVTQTPAKEKAKEGETVVLNCHFSSPQHPSLTGLPVRWYKEDEKGQTDLLKNNVTMLPNNSRVFMSRDLSQGIVSLVILNVTISDHGIYFCEVTLPDGKVMKGDGTKLRIRRALVYALTEGAKLVCLVSRRYGLVLNTFQSQQINTSKDSLSHYLTKKKYNLLCQEHIMQVPFPHYLLKLLTH
uniref:Ig-like domain-containing protein n=1 Tax=Phasianus colchicus TaxID=9054 RepID=A0A669QS65_PHACC